MSAYLIANYRVTNREGYEQYMAVVAPTLPPFQGEPLVMDFQSTGVEGEVQPVTIVVKFPDMETARSWYDSEAYRAVRDLRIDNTEGTVLFAEGLS